MRLLWVTMASAAVLMLAHGFGRIAVKSALLASGFLALYIWLKVGDRDWKAWLGAHRKYRRTWLCIGCGHQWAEEEKEGSGARA